MIVGAKDTTSSRVSVDKRVCSCLIDATKIEEHVRRQVTYPIKRDLSRSPDQAEDATTKYGVEIHKQEAYTSTMQQNNRSLFESEK